MASYYLNEAVVDLSGRSFVDKTVHGLESKLPGGQALGVFVQRSPAEAGKSLRELVDENIALNDRRLLGFRVLDSASATIGGLPGVVLRTSWRGGSGDLHQLQAHVLVGAKHMVFAVGGPLSEREACDETFESIVRTLTWRVD